MSDAIGMNQLAQLLADMDQKAKVYFDFSGYARPTTIDSYRGYYDRPALGFALGGYAGDDHSGETTVAELIESLTTAKSSAFEGWKGGTYRYSGDEALFVDNPGDASGVVVTGLIAEGWRVTITTAYEPHAY